MTAITLLVLPLAFGLAGCPEDAEDGTQPADMAAAPGDVADTIGPADTPPSPADVPAPTDDGPPPTDDGPPPADDGPPPADVAPPPPECEPKDPLGPFSVMLGGEGELSGPGTVTDVGPYCCDANWDWQLTITLDSGDMISAVGQLPGGGVPPLLIGESVLAHQRVDMPWWVESWLAVYGEAGDLRFFAFQGSKGLGPPAACAGCPTVTLQDTACPPVEGFCGMRVHPPATIDLGAAGTLDLKQGETESLGDLAVSVGTAHRWTEVNCTDTPNTWMEVWALGKAPESKCNTEKIALTPSNPELYEFYELCLAEGTDPSVVQAIDSSLYCGVGGFFAKCNDATETGCHGDLAYLPAGKTLTAEKWAQLCALSLLSEVSKLAGGHFL